MRATKLLLPYVAVIVGLDLAKSAWLAVLLYHAGMILILWSEGDRGILLSLQRGWRWGMGAFMVLLAAFSGIIFYLLFPQARLSSVNLAEQLKLFGLSGASLWLFAAYFATISAVLEELYWRGSIRDGTSSLHLGDIAFAGYHLLVLRYFLEPVWLVIALIVLTVVAWVWRQSLNHLQGLAIPAATHVVADISIMIVFIKIAGS